MQITLKSDRVKKMVLFPDILTIQRLKTYVNMFEESKDSGSQSENELFILT